MYPLKAPILHRAGTKSLTPKRLNVCTMVLVGITSTHTIFRIFETFCEDVSYNKLCKLCKLFEAFLDFRIKCYGCLKFLREGWTCKHGEHVLGPMN